MTKHSDGPLLEVEDIHLAFAGRPILRGVTLKVERGQTMVILGGSGCGKSTLLRVLVGAINPDRGTVRILGHDRSELSVPELDRLRIRLGMMFQSGALFHSMTVGENIACVLREHTAMTEEEIAIMVQVKLEMVGLRHAVDLLPDEISGGMRKRAALARALALDPQVMLYDEPGAGLDPVTLAGVDRLIDTLGRVLNMASVVVTHEMASAMRIADQMVYLHEGRVVAAGTPEEIRAHPDPRLQQFLAGSADGPLTAKGADDDFARSLIGAQ
ncbi:MAG: ABC transporter ATP-binding protein [Planctomycetota bacterium]